MSKNVVLTYLHMHFPFAVACLSFSGSCVASSLPSERDRARSFCSWLCVCVFVVLIVVVVVVLQYLPDQTSLPPEEPCVKSFISKAVNAETR